MVIISSVVAKLAADSLRSLPLKEQIMRADPFLMPWIDGRGLRGYIRFTPPTRRFQKKTPTE